MLTGCQQLTITDQSILVMVSGSSKTRSSSPCLAHAIVHLEFHTSTTQNPNILPRNINSKIHSRHTTQMITNANIYATFQNISHVFTHIFTTCSQLSAEFLCLSISPVSRLLLGLFVDDQLHVAHVFLAQTCVSFT